MKKAPPNEPQDDTPRRPGRPPTGVPAVSNAERQRAFRERLKREGKVTLHLAVVPAVIEQLDSLRDEESSREDVVERLIEAAVRRKRR